MRSGRWGDFVEGPLFVSLVLFLVAVRFVASTATAYAGIQGMDTRGLDVAFEIYSDVLLLVLLSLLAVLLSSWSRKSWREPAFLLFVGLAVATVVEWLGTVDASLRFMGGPLGPWADLLLGITAAAATASLTFLLSRQLERRGLRNLGLQGFRTFGYGFAAAYALRSLRLLDFAYVLGWSMPSGALWVLDFGPSLLLACLVLPFWVRLAVRRARGRESLPRSWLLPILGAGVALLAAVGVLGGFVLSNALAWGGSYLVFSPTAASLPIMGFAIGAYLATAWSLRGKISAVAWRLIFGGVGVAALAGIQTSAGTLASVAGLLMGIACAARGLAVLAGQQRPDEDIRASI